MLLDPVGVGYGVDGTLSIGPRPYPILLNPVGVVMPCKGYITEPRVLALGGWNTPIHQRLRSVWQRHQFKVLHYLKNFYSNIRVISSLRYIMFYLACVALSSLQITIRTENRNTSQTPFIKIILNIRLSIEVMDVCII